MGFLKFVSCTLLVILYSFSLGRTAVIPEDNVDQTTIVYEQIVQNDEPTDNPEVQWVMSDAVTEPAVENEIEDKVREKRSIQQDDDETFETTTVVTRGIVKRDVDEEGTTPVPINEEIEVQDEVQSEISWNDDDEDDFKYPTTPYPDTDGDEERIPFVEVDPIPKEMIREINGHRVVVGGNKSCSCGKPNTRIVGGEDASINELPWTVALIRTKSNGEQQQGPYCGGTLINDRYVATASHCVDGFQPEKIQVWLNEEDFRVEDENEDKTIKIDVESIKMHENYNARNIENDIALLKLATPVDITAGLITPACVPADNSDLYEGQDAIVAGWGAKEQGGPVSATLQKVTVPVLSNKHCNSRTLYLGKIQDSQVCAGKLSGGKDSCQGDSGGPLVVQQNNVTTLIGIVSYGYGCALPLAPGVYTRVGSFSDWIVANTPDGEYCTSD